MTPDRKDCALRLIMLLPVFGVLCLKPSGSGHDSRSKLRPTGWQSGFTLGNPSNAQTLETVCLSLGANHIRLPVSEQPQSSLQRLDSQSLQYV